MPKELAQGSLWLEGGLKKQLSSGKMHGDRQESGPKALSISLKDSQMSF